MLLKGSVQENVKADFSDKAKPDQAAQKCSLAMGAAEAPEPKSKESGSPAPGPAPALAGNASFASGLGKDVDVIVEKSPTLKGNLTKLQQSGWKLTIGEKGKGSWASKGKKEIVIDGNKKGNAVSIAQTLAHESGHALYTEDPYIPPKGLTREQFVARNAKRHLKDEGEATLTNIIIRNEILANKGPDIGIAGTKVKEYEEIAKKYPDPKDRDTARSEIGDIYAKREIGSKSKKPYGEIYRGPYEDFWDKHAAAKKKK